MSRAPLPEPPSLRSVAELLHVHAATGSGPVIAYVEDRPPRSLALGLWPVPPAVRHPADPLIGFRAPTCWGAIGLTASGRVRALDRPGHEPEDITVTVVLDRTGAAISVLDGPEGVRTLEDPPVGWAADALARVLGRPTPAPAETPAQWVEATWLDRLAAGLLARPERRRSWRWFTDRHPLTGPSTDLGIVPSPADLAARTRRHAQVPWAELRRFADSATASALGPDPIRPPAPGTTVSAAEWFDDGSFARWLLSSLPPVDLLLPDLLAVLGHQRGHDLLDALVWTAPVTLAGGR